MKKNKVRITIEYDEEVDGVCPTCGGHMDDTERAVDTETVPNDVGSIMDFLDHYDPESSWVTGVKLLRK